MVIPPARPRNTSTGALMADLVVAMALLALLILPICYGFWDESKTARAYYQRALVMELVDGDMEILAAGGWKSFPPGTHPYIVASDAATNLPPGRFVLTMKPPHLTLTWQPRGPGAGNPVSREYTIHVHP